MQEACEIFRLHQLKIQYYEAFSGHDLFFSPGRRKKAGVKSVRGRPECAASGRLIIFHMAESSMGGGCPTLFRKWGDAMKRDMEQEKIR
jgi:hypothetical protein